MKCKMLKIILPAIIVVAITGCFKDPSGTGGGSTGDFLKYSKAHVYVTNKQGTKDTVLVQSNLHWQLSLEAPVPNWVSLDKSLGSNNQSLVITATQDNPTSGYRFATVIATPRNVTSVLPVRLTVVQYDSSFKGK
jgi:hypothetical protein